MKKKNIFIILCSLLNAVIVFVLITKNNSSNFKNKAVEESVENYYSNKLHDNKGELKINVVKEIKSGYLVLAEKNYGEGESYSTLFLLNTEKELISQTSGRMPISPGFSANRVEYMGTNIIFGTINDSKMKGVNEVGRIGIEVSEIRLEFTNGENLTDNTIENKSYIIVTDKKDIKDILLYNNNNKLQDKMSDYDWEEFINKVKFQEA